MNAACTGGVRLGRRAEGRTGSRLTNALVDLRIPMHQKQYNSTEHETRTESVERAYEEGALRCRYSRLRRIPPNMAWRGGALRAVHRGRLLSAARRGLLSAFAVASLAQEAMDAGGVAILGRLRFAPYPRNNRQCGWLLAVFSFLVCVCGGGGGGRGGRTVGVFATAAAVLMSTDGGGVVCARACTRPCVPSASRRCVCGPSSGRLRVAGRGGGQGGTLDERLKARMQALEEERQRRVQAALEAEEAAAVRGRLLRGRRLSPPLLGFEKPVSVWDCA
jgi:hypothetical protein